MTGPTSTSASIIDPNPRRIERVELVKTFYRVLTPDCAGVPGTIQRWIGRQFTSTHSRVPGHWSEIWNRTKSRDPKDYPLGWNGCTSTFEARNAYLQLAPTHQPADRWPDDELNRVGEYEGVSAYDEVQEALNYGEGAPGKRYVIFEGEQLAPLPEPRGYRVKFTKELTPMMSREEFCRWIELKKKAQQTGSALTASQP